MPTTLFFDFETTGFVRESMPYDHKSQPHIVQVAAALCDDDTPNGEPIQQIDVIVKPDGWRIPPSSLAVHGITMKDANARGVPEWDAIMALLELIEKADLIVAHNLAFDWKILNIAAARFLNEAAMSRLSASARSAYCTMEASRDLCRIPPTQKMLDAGFSQFKSPRLEEAYQILLGQEMTGAHNALHDVTACRRVFHEIQRRESHKKSRFYRSFGVVAATVAIGFLVWWL